MIAHAAVPVSPAFAPTPPPASAPPVASAPVVQRGSLYRMPTHREPPTTALPSNATENSGSLTGFVLSHGSVDVPGPRSRGFVVILVLMLVVAVMLIIGVFAAAATGDAVTAWFDRMFSR